MSKNSELIKRLRADAVARGLCYTCRCRFPRPGVRNCDECLARGRRFAHGPGRKKAYARSARYDRNRRERLRVAGLCTHCGRREPCDGRTKCSVCLDHFANCAVALRDGERVRPQPSCSVCGQVGHSKRRHDRPGVLP